MATDKEIYRGKLSDPRWHEKREEVFAEYGKKCNRCGGNRNLNVHHRKYINGKEPWEYPLTNFEVLCDGCHTEEHGISQEPKFCSNPKCPTSRVEIRQCYSYCFPCNQKLSAILRRKEEELSEAIDKARLVDSTKDELRKAQKDLRQREVVLKELTEHINELRRQAEEDSSDSKLADSYAQELENANSRLDKAGNELEQVTNKMNALEAETKKDQTMRVILFLMLMVVISLISYSIFWDKNVDQNSPLTAAKGGLSEREAPMASAVFSLKNAGDFVGEFVNFEARVFQVTITKQKHAFINFGGVYPDQLFSLIVFERSRDLVPVLPEVGDVVNVSGVVEIYNGSPRIVLDSSAQLIF